MTREKIKAIAAIDKALATTAGEAFHEGRNSALKDASIAQAMVAATDMEAELAAAYRRGQEAMRERAAVACERADKRGREWVAKSLWDNIARESAAAIRALPIEGVSK